MIKWIKSLFVKRVMTVGELGEMLIEEGKKIIETPGYVDRDGDGIVNVREVLGFIGKKALLERF